MHILPVEEVTMNNIIWSFTPFSIDELSPYINWNSIKRKRYFYIRENKKDSSLHLRIATLKSCGQKISMDLNHKYLNISNLELAESVAMSKINGDSYKNDHSINKRIKTALEKALKENLI